MRRWLLFSPVCRSSLVEGRGLCQVRRERTALCIGRRLLGLNRTKVIAAPMAAVVDKVAVAERLLEVLASLGLEATSTVLLALASARA